MSRKLDLAATAAEANSMNRWLLSLACLSLFFPSPSHADDRPRPSENASGSELPFRLSSGYLIQVEGRIGEHTHLKFILDTGATISMVDQRIAQKLKLDAHPAQSFNFDRNLQWETATIPEVQFGPIRAANVAVLVGDLARYSEFAGKADAIIGMDLLNLSNLTIDFAAGNLIFDPDRAKNLFGGRRSHGKVPDRRASGSGSSGSPDCRYRPARHASVRGAPAQERARITHGGQHQKRDYGRTRASKTSHFARC